jgi:geranylgeranyl diphosphate synthase, type II
MSLPSSATSVNYKTRFGPRIDHVNQSLSRYLTPYHAPSPLWEAIRYAILGGGKRFRPVLLLETCLACGGQLETAMATACALEMIHGASLIHDDLPCMDNDDLRRGKPTTHKAFGEDTALLAGDALNVWVYSLIIENTPRNTLAPETVLRIVSKLATAASIGQNGSDGLVSGQVFDMMASRNHLQDETTLLQIHTGKTAALIAFATEAGALFAGYSDLECEPFRRLGHLLGLMFQIQDDLLDITSTSDALGKSIGKDAAQDKLTFPCIYGLEESQQKLFDCRDAALAILNDLTQTTAARTIDSTALHHLVMFLAERDQ